VTLEIYNVLGQRIAENSYGTMDAGRYNEVVNMNKFTSGVYFYRLVASAVEPVSAIGTGGQNFISIKKFVLMK